jgi:hypothetical protein
LGDQAPAVASSIQPTVVARLAKFFPHATPVRLPVRLFQGTDVATTASKATVIEFGTAQEVLFASAPPLEFAEMLRLQNSDGSLDAEASVAGPCHTTTAGAQLQRALSAMSRTGS